MEDAGYTSEKLIDNNENIIRYIAKKNGYGYVVDTKRNVLAISTEKIVDDIYNIATEYYGNLKNNIDLNPTNLMIPRNEEEYKEFIANTVEKINYYTEEMSEEYKIGITDRCLLCFYDKVMSIEKIEICEAMNIYLSGDINGDHIVDWWDKDALQLYINTQETDKKRETLLADLNSDDVVNSADKGIINSVFNNLMKDLYGYDSLYFWKIKRERSDKYNKGEITDQTSATSEEIKNYITTYKEEVGPYKLIIRKGELYWEYDKTKKHSPSYIKTTGIYILGDINGDNVIDKNDVINLELVIKEPEEWSAINPDLDDDGDVDLDDLELLKEMVK